MRHFSFNFTFIRRKFKRERKKLRLEPDLRQFEAELRSGTNDSGSVSRRGSDPMRSRIHHTMTGEILVESIFLEMMLGGGFF